MTREEFIGKLRSIYVGEENAIDEIISEYDKLKSIRKESIEQITCKNILNYLQELKENK